MKTMAEVTEGYVILSPYTEIDEWPIESISIHTAVLMAKLDQKGPIYLDELLTLVEDPDTKQAINLFVSHLENCKRLQIIAFSQHELTAIRLFRKIRNMEIVYKKRDWEDIEFITT
jgi:hypothetical protein